MRKTLLILLAIVVYSCKPNLSKEETSSIKLDDIITEIDSIKSFNGIVGILHKGKEPQIVYHGFKSPQTRKSPLDSTDYFHLASNSKLFTGFSIMKIMDDFGLKHTDSIAPYFPELQSPLQQVTIQQLANHTCAIHDFFFID